MTQLLARSRVDLLLLLVAASWGSTYLVAKELVTPNSVVALLAARMLLAVALMAAVVAVRRTRVAAGELRIGVLLGMLLAAVFALETFGIAHTSATNAGLIISLTIVFTPILESVVSRRRLPARFLLAAAIAVVGVGLLAGGGAVRPPGLGDLLVLAAAVARAVHVVSMHRLTAARPLDSLHLTAVQLATCAVVFSVLSLVAGESIPQFVVRLDPGEWALFLFLVVVCTVLAFLIQMWAVRRTSPARVSLLLGTEPVWAAVVGIVIAHDPVTAVGGVGIALVLLGTAWGRSIEQAGAARVGRSGDEAVRDRLQARHRHVVLASRGEGVPADRPGFLGERIGLGREADTGRTDVPRHPAEQGSERPGVAEPDRRTAVTIQVDAAGGEHRQQLPAGQQRLTEAVCVTGELRQAAESDALGVHPGIGDEMDRQPAGDVGLLPDADPRRTEHLAHRPAPDAQAAVVRSEPDGGEEPRTQRPIRLEAAAGSREAPLDVVGRDGAGRVRQVVPEIAEDEHGRSADPRREEGHRGGKPVVGDADDDQIEAVLRRQLLSEADGPAPRDPGDPGQSAEVGELEVDRRAVLGGPAGAHEEFDLMPGLLEGPAVDRRDDAPPEHQNLHIRHRI